MKRVTPVASQATALALARHIDPIARDCGAANTLVAVPAEGSGSRRGEWSAHNTDWLGAVGAIEAGLTGQDLHDCYARAACALLCLSSSDGTWKVCIQMYLDPARLLCSSNLYASLPPLTAKNCYARATCNVSAPRLLRMPGKGLHPKITRSCTSVMLEQPVSFRSSAAWFATERPASKDN